MLLPSLGVQLKRLRTRRKLGVREVALRSGVSHSTISLIERDRVSPSVDTLLVIVSALDMALADFFCEFQSTRTYRPRIARADRQKSSSP